MKAIRLFTIVMALLGTSLSIQAQIIAPDLLCIRNDSLFWDIPVNTCGIDSAYQIWMATDINGPYSLLAEIADLSQDHFFASNPGNLMRFFYMTTLADCPGQEVQYSDTLDNRPPARIPIDYVSVENGNVAIYWSSLSDPDVVGYIVYKVTDLGTVPVDTLIEGPYVDLDAQAGTQLEFYYVNALDACGNTSFFDDPHNTILLDYQVDICDQSAIINWNAYQNWSNGIEKHTVYLSKNGAPFELIGETSGSVTQFKISSLKRDTIYNFRVGAIENVTGFESLSNEISFNPNVTEGVSPFVLYNADINPNGSIKLEWYWSGDVNVDSVFLNVFDLTQGTEVIVNQKVPGLIAGAEFQTYSVDGLMPETNQYAISLLAFNTCNLEGRSNTQTTIFLTGSFDANTATLNWNQNNPYVQMQRVLIQQDGSFSELALVSAERQTHTHTWPDTDASNCYMISDSGQVVSPQGVVRTFTQRSNTTCIFRGLSVYIPNAFAPTGVNREFIPYFSSTALIKEYRFDVYDRWGGKLFSTENFYLGWNGYINDKLMPSGLYTYMLEITTISDEKIIRNGDVLLIR